MYMIKMVCQAKAFLLTYSTLRSHVLSPIRPKHYRMVGLKTIETDIFIKASVGFLSPPTKALDGYTHIVIDHHGKDTMYIPQKLRWGFHETGTYSDT